MKVKYEVASVEYAEQILTLENELFSVNKFNYNQILSELNSSNRHYVIAVVGEQVVGFAGVNKGLDFAEVMKIAVSKSFQNRGIASQLLNHLVSHCKQTGLFKIMLEVSSINLPAINFYKKFGFNKIHTRKNYYSDRTDAIIFELKI